MSVVCPQGSKARANFKKIAKTINVTSKDDPAVQSEEFLELANGCLCCSIKDAGIAAIEKLMERRGAFDYIVLETTGLADPGAWCSTFHPVDCSNAEAHRKDLLPPYFGRMKSIPLV